MTPRVVQPGRASSLRPGDIHQSLGTLGHMSCLSAFVELVLSVLVSGTGQSPLAIISWANDVHFVSYLGTPPEGLPYRSQCLASQGPRPARHPSPSRQPLDSIFILSFPYIVSHPQGLWPLPGCVQEPHGSHTYLICTSAVCLCFARHTDRTQATKLPPWSCKSTEAWLWAVPALTSLELWQHHS